VDVAAAVSEETVRSRLSRALKFLPRNLMWSLHLSNVFTKAKLSTVIIPTYKIQIYYINQRDAQFLN
jgi:hypothetical protein